MFSPQKNTSTDNKCSREMEKRKPFPQVASAPLPMSFGDGLGREQGTRRLKGYDQTNKSPHRSVDGGHSFATHSHQIGDYTKRISSCHSAPVSSMGMTSKEQPLDPMDGLSDLTISTVTTSTDLDTKVLFQSGGSFRGNAVEVCNAPSKRDSDDTGGEVADGVLFADKFIRRAEENAMEKSRIEASKQGRTNEYEKSGFDVQSDVVSDDSKPFECDVCNRRFCTWFGLNKHAIISHDVKSHRERRFHRNNLHADDLEESMIRNLQVACSIPKLLKYDPVGEAIKGISTLEEHELEHRTGYGMWQEKTRERQNVSARQSLRKDDPNCSKGGLKYSKSRIPENRERLVWNSGQNVFTCRDCGERFPTKTSLAQHCMVHADSNVFKCQKCESIFRGTDCFRQHLKFHLNEAAARQAGNNYGPAMGRPNLEGHTYVYSRPQELKCMQCNGNYSSRLMFVPPQRCNCQRCRGVQAMGTHTSLAQKQVPPSISNLLKCKQCGSVFPKKLAANQRQATQSNIRRGLSVMGVRSVAAHGPGRPQQLVYYTPQSRGAPDPRFLHNINMNHPGVRRGSEQASNRVSSAKTRRAPGSDYAYCNCDDWSGATIKFEF